jgi:hypothetical protein
MSGRRLAAIVVNSVSTSVSAKCIVTAPLHSELAALNDYQLLEVVLQ